MSNTRRLRSSGRPVTFPAALARRRCSECGSAGLDWLTVGQAAERGLPVAVWEGLLLDAGEGGVQDIWQCRACGESGAFGSGSGWQTL